MTQTKTNVLQQIEDLLGSEGSPNLAEHMFTVLKNRGALAFNANTGYTLRECGTEEWLDMLGAAHMLDRIQYTAERAEQAFWEVVAKEFTEATSGDCDPLGAFNFSNAMRSAIEDWVRYNVPGQNEEEELGEGQ